MDQGNRVDPSKFTQTIAPSNLVKLATWMTVGSDVEWGQYAMLGARVGCYDLAIANEPCHLELDILGDTFEILHKLALEAELAQYKGSVEQRLGLAIPELDEAASKFFKFTQPLHKNRGVQDLEN